MFVKKSLLISISIATAISIAACDSDNDLDSPASIADMSFFVTSNGLDDGGNLGGLAGADVHCANLAAAASASATEWRLSLIHISEPTRPY